MIQKIFFISFFCLMIIEIWFHDLIPNDYALLVHALASIALLALLISHKMSSAELRKKENFERAFYS